MFVKADLVLAIRKLLTNNYKMKIPYAAELDSFFDDKFITLRLNGTKLIWNSVRQRSIGQ